MRSAVSALVGSALAVSLSSLRNRPARKRPPRRRAGQARRDGPRRHAPPSPPMKPTAKAADAKAAPAPRSAIAGGINGPARRLRNNTPVGKNIPAEWEPGDFDTKTGEWKKRDQQEHQVGRQARLAKLWQPGRRRRQDLGRHQQRRRLAEALSRPRPIWAACCASTRLTANSSGSTRAKSCPPAAFTTGRCKASAAHAVCRRQAAVVRHQPRRGHVPRHRGLSRRQEQRPVRIRRKAPTRTRPTSSGA